MILKCNRSVMSIWGKIIGGATGFAFGGPLGALLGGAAGHAIDKIKTKSKDEPINIFNEAINNIKPTVEVRSRRVGGATYQVPVEVKSKRAQALAIRWLVDSARKRKDKHMSDKIFNELFDAYEKKGAAVKKREDVHKMAESNKAFAHFRW